MHKQNSFSPHLFFDLLPVLLQHFLLVHHDNFNTVEVTVGTICHLFVHQFLVLFEVVDCLNDQDLTVDNFFPVSSHVVPFELPAVDVGGHQTHFRREFADFLLTHVVGSQFVNRSNLQFDSETCLLHHLPNSLLQVLSHHVVSMNFPSQLLNLVLFLVCVVHVHPRVELFLKKVPL